MKTNSSAISSEEARIVLRVLEALLTAIPFDKWLSLYLDQLLVVAEEVTHDRLD